MQNIKAKCQFLSFNESSASLSPVATSTESSLLFSSFFSSSFDILSASCSVTVTTAQSKASLNFLAFSLLAKRMASVSAFATSSVKDIQLANQVTPTNFQLDYLQSQLELATSKLCHFLSSVSKASKAG